MASSRGDATFGGSGSDASAIRTLEGGATSSATPDEPRVASTNVPVTRVAPAALGTHSVTSTAAIPRARVSVRGGRVPYVPPASLVSPPAAIGMARHDAASPRSLVTAPIAITPVPSLPVAISPHGGWPARAVDADSSPVRHVARTSSPPSRPSPPPQTPPATYGSSPQPPPTHTRAVSELTALANVLASRADSVSPHGVGAPARPMPILHRTNAGHTTSTATSAPATSSPGASITAVVYTNANVFAPPSLSPPSLTITIANEDAQAPIPTRPISPPDAAIPTPSSLSPLPASPVSPTSSFVASPLGGLNAPPPLLPATAITALELELDLTPPGLDRPHTHAVGSASPYAARATPALPAMAVSSPRHLTTTRPIHGSTVLTDDQLRSIKAAATAPTPRAQRDVLGLTFTDDPQAARRAHEEEALRIDSLNGSPRVEPSSPVPTTKRGWSVPTRSISGRSGFNSNTFRPMLQKDTYAASGSATSTPSQTSSLRTPSHRVTLSTSMPPFSLGSAANGVLSSLPESGGDGGAGVDAHEVVVHLDMALHRPAAPSLSTGPDQTRSRTTSLFANTINGPTSPRVHKLASPRSSLTPSTSCNKDKEKSTPVSVTERLLAALDSIPSCVPGARIFARILLHPAYLFFSFLLTLIGVFALDFTLAFLSSRSADRHCDILLLIIGGWWCVELALLSVALPGYFLRNFWWYMDAMSIVSIVVDIGLLRHLSLGLAPFEYSASDVSWRPGGSFHGLSHSGGDLPNAKVWLFLHYARLVRLFKHWNGLECLAGTFSMQRCFERLGHRADRARAASPAHDAESGSRLDSSSDFHKPSSLSAHLANRMQRSLTMVLLATMCLFSLLAPTPFAVNNNAACRNGGDANFNDFSSMEQWAVAHMDALYATALSEGASASASDATVADIVTAAQTTTSYAAASGIAESLLVSFGDIVLQLSMAADPSSTLSSASFVSWRNDNISSRRSVEVALFTCGGSVLALSNSSRVHDAAIWNILLLVALLCLFVIAQAHAAYGVAHAVGQPLERMAKVVRRMASTVLFMRPDAKTPRDPWDKAHGDLDTSLSSASLSGWASMSGSDAHSEFDVLEEVLTKMSSVFNLLPGGLSTSLLDASSGGTAAGEDKARRVMLGSRRTEIKTRDSILTIDVVERPITDAHATNGSASPIRIASPTGGNRTAGHAQRDTFDGDFFVDHLGSHPALTDVSPPPQSTTGRASLDRRLPALGGADSGLSYESHPELRSLESLLADPLACTHFKHFLHRKLCLESMTFYEQVAKYKARMQSWAFRIYHQFVVAGAPSEINIQSSQRAAISSEIFHPSLDIFNLAQREVYKLMKNNFLEYIVSQSCAQYVAAKTHRQLTIRVGQELLT